MKSKNLNLRKTLFFYPLFLTPLFSHSSPDETVKEIYHKALLEYKEKNFSKSKALFSKALKKKENHPSILYNLALSEFQSKNYGMALALWRKTLSLFPLHTPTRKALTLVQKLNNPPLSEKNLKYKEVFRNRILSYFTLNFILSSTLLLLLISGLLILNRLKRNSLEEEKRFTLSFLSYFIFTLFFISSLLSGAKIYDHMRPRATIVTPSVQLRLGPREEDNALLELKEGVQVIFREKRKKWLRVISENGTMGWIIDSSVLQTSGRGLK